MKRVEERLEMLRIFWSGSLRVEATWKCSA